MPAAGIWVCDDMLEIKGRLRGEREVQRALHAALRVFLRFFKAWLRDERARFVGGPDSRGRKRQGFRDILARRRLKSRQGTWSRQMAHLFKGYVEDAKRIEDLLFKAGVGLRSQHQMIRALWRLQEGGTIRSQKQMPVPVYRNLALRMGIRSGFHKAKAFRRLARKGQLVGIKEGGRVYYFDPESKRKSGRGFLKSGLLFVGLFGIRVPKMFVGRYDFYARWNRMLPAMLNRGQGVADRAATAVDRGRTA
jgi:hypothetical protein